MLKFSFWNFFNEIISYNILFILYLFKNIKYKKY